MGRIFFSLLFFVVSFLAHAQEYSMYQQITTADGLPSNYVFGVCEDRHGFLWAGTDKGLSRYDGFRWKTWNSNNGLPGNYVTRVLPDRNDGCWILIPDKGLYHFRNGKVVFTGAATVASTSLSVDDEGRLYVETFPVALPGTQLLGLLYSREEPVKPDTILRVSDAPAVAIRTNVAERVVYCILKTANDELVVRRAIRTKWPLRIIVPEHNDAYDPRLTIYYISDSVLINSAFFVKRKGKNPVITPFSFFGKKDGYAFSCVTPDGYYTWDIHSGYYFIDQQGRATFYDRRQGLGSDYVNHIYQSKDGTLLISTLGAGIKLRLKTDQNTIIAGYELVNGLQSNQKQWYLLSADRVFAKHSESRALVQLGRTPGASISLLRSGDTLLVTSLHGLSIYKERNNQLQLLRHIAYPSGLSQVIRMGDHFIAGTYGNGLLQLSVKTLDTQSYQYPLKIVERIKKLPDGFAALSYEKGCFITRKTASDNRQFDQSNGLLGNDAYSVFSDHDTIWIGTSGGINGIINNRVSVTKRFPVNENEKALYVFRDRLQRLWVVGTNGLYEAREARLVKIGSVPLVKKGILIGNAVYDPDTDELGIVSGQAFITMSMSAVHPEKKVMPPGVLSLYIDNDTTTTDPMRIPAHFTRLRYFIIPGSASPLVQNRIYYQLEGVSTTWIEVKDSLQILIEGLGPGKYVLHAKTINSDGYESDVVVLSKFRIYPPFWQQPFFIIGCVFVTAFAAYAFTRTTERIRQRKKLEQSLLLQQERERISKDLHDHLGSNLAIIIAQADHIETKMERNEFTDAAKTLGQLSIQTRATMQLLRETVWSVQESDHSLDELIIRVRMFLQRIYDTAGLSWEVKSEVKQPVQLSAVQTLHLLRIIQEASQNILKHAGATQAEYVFSLDNDNLLKLTIADNGKGMIEKTTGVTSGIRNMESRAADLGGDMEIESREGCIIRVRIPLKNN